MTTMSGHAGTTKWQSSNQLPRKAYSVIGRKKPPSDCGSTTSRKSLSTMMMTRIACYNMGVPVFLGCNRRSRSTFGSTRERTVKKLRLAKALTIPDGTTVLDACRRMVIRRVDAALLTDSSALLCGIITDKDVTTRVIAEGLKPEETLVSKVMTRNPLFVMSDTSAVEALQKMVQGKFRHLPVVEDGEVTGLLDITRCLYDAISRMERVAEKGNAIAAAVEGVERQWGNTELGSMNLVDALREKMFRPSLGSLIEEGSNVAIVLPSDTVVTAAKKMKDLQVSSAVVSTNNKPQGILTSKDIMMRVVRNNLQPDTTTVEQVMTPSPECVTVDTSIVDALHTMHDGKFLHLPVVDQDGLIVACLDVLQLTQAAIAIVGTDTGGTVDMTSTVLQRFWDSALLLEPPVDDDDRHSDGSMTKSYADHHEPDQIKHPSIGPFAFKIEDAGGRVHRFQSGTESLTELKAAILHRVGIGANQLPGITYEDEEGDHVILATDNDLAIAVNHARMSGRKVIKLHLDYNSSKLKTQPQPIYKDVKNGLTKENCSRIQKEWIPTVYSNVMVAAVVAASLGVVIYWRRSNS